MLEQGFTQKEIADTIGKNKSVISREIKRNCNKRNGRGIILILLIESILTDWEISRKRKVLIKKLSNT